MKHMKHPRLPQIKGVLFDLDGTLLDTAPDFEICLNMLCVEQNQIPIDIKRLRPAVSQGTPGMLKFALQVTPDSEHYSLLQKRFHELYAQEIGNHTTFFPDIVLLLNHLLTHNHPWGIVTNKPDRFTKRLVENFVPLPKAHCVISGDTLKAQKPDPLPLLHACHELNIAPEQCLYVGDAKTDIEASQNAGLISVLAEYGYLSPDQDLKSYGADYTIKNPRELIALLA